VQRGVDLTGAPVGRGHGSRWHRRRRLGRHGISLRSCSISGCH